MTKYRAALLEFGENVLKREAGVGEQKLAILWDKGHWLERAADTGDRIVGCPGGVAKARAVKHLASEAERWDRQIYDKMVWLPWAATEDELNLMTNGHRQLAARLARPEPPRSASASRSAVSDRSSGHIFRPTSEILNEDSQRRAPQERRVRGPTWLSAWQGAQAILAKRRRRSGIRQPARPAAWPRRPPRQCQWHLPRTPGLQTSTPT